MTPTVDPIETALLVVRALDALGIPNTIVRENGPADSRWAGHQEERRIYDSWYRYGDSNPGPVAEKRGSRRRR